MDVPLCRLLFITATGIILNNVGLLRSFAAPDILSKSTDVDRRRIHYPPTPPLSDYSDSRPLSPQDDLSVGHKPFLTLHTSPHQNASRSTICEACSYVLPADTASLDSKNQPLTLHVLTRESSKPFIATISRSIAKTERRNSKVAIKDTFALSVNGLESYLEGIPLFTRSLNITLNFLRKRWIVPSRLYDYTSCASLEIS